MLLATEVMLLILGSGMQELRYTVDQLFEVRGRGSGDCFGIAVVCRGDLDGDGAPDIVVGAKNESAHVGFSPDHKAEQPVSGYVQVISGQTLKTVFEQVSSSSGSGFALDVDVIGDVNSDGSADIAVGAPILDGLLLALLGMDGPSPSGAKGKVLVLSGSSGEVIRVMEGEPFFGRSLKGLGDVNGDGTPDIVVGTPVRGKDLPGRVELRSGEDGSVLWRSDGETPNGLFGQALAVYPDANGDGVAEVLVGDKMACKSVKQSGSAYLLSGLDGKRLQEWSGDAPWTYFGASVSTIGDTDGDGHSEILIGATGSKHGGKHSGSAFVLCGKTGSIVMRVDGDAGTELGVRCAGLGDISGDGIPDFGVAAKRDLKSDEKDGYVRVYSGHDARLLCQVPGRAVFSGGDLNVDGRVDFVTSSYVPSRGNKLVGTTGLVRGWNLTTRGQ